MSLASIVNIQITRNSYAPTQVGFGRLLVLGASGRFNNSDLIRVYTGLDGMLSDGFLTTDPEYKAANKYFSQPTRPVDIAIGLRSIAAVAQVDTVTVVVVNSHAYTIIINGVACSYTSDSDATAGEITAGLISAINTASLGVTAGGASGLTFTITAGVAGTGFTSQEFDTDISIAHTTANKSVQTPSVALAAIKASSSDLGDNWFGLMLTSHLSADILDAADYCESRRKLFGFSTSDTDVRDNVSMNFAATLLADAYAATWGIWSADAANYPEAAWFGGQFPYVPGSNTWQMKQLIGIVADNLTDTQIAHLDALNMTHYETVAGRGVTKGAKVFADEWIDTIILADWTQQRMAEGVFALLATTPKVPFTDEGISQVGSVVSGVLKQGQQNGGYAPRDLDNKAFIVSLPLASSFTQEQRQTRILTGISFVGFLAGAIHNVDITGDISA